MKGNRLKSTYLDLSYRLVRLFEAKKRELEILSETEFEERSARRGNLLRMDRGEKIVRLNQMIKDIEKRLMVLINQANCAGIKIPFEELSKEHSLSKKEKYVLLVLFFSETNRRRSHLSGRDLLFFLGYKPSQFIEKSNLFQRLIKKKLIEITDSFQCWATIFDAEFCLSLKTLRHIMGNEKWILNESADEHLSDGISDSRKRPSQSLIVVRNPLFNFDQIILDKIKEKKIERAIYQLKNRKKVFEEWGFAKTIKYGKGVTLLFYGPPGTGKTATCEAIAYSLNKKIGIANYASILNRWVGNSEKNAIAIFEEAKKEDCVLVFDEAESLFATRLTEIYSTDRMHNYMTNILMQEVEKFEGVLILTTNREIVLDEAFDRRILLKLRFDMPKPAERARIWRALIPKEAPLDKNICFEELGKRFGLTGGEIKNAILNAVTECRYRGEKSIAMAILTEFAQKEYIKTGRNNNKKVGFTV